MILFGVLRLPLYASSYGGVALSVPLPMNMQGTKSTCCCFLVIKSSVVDEKERGGYTIAENQVCPHQKKGSNLALRVCCMKTPASQKWFKGLLHARGAEKETVPS